MYIAVDKVGKSYPIRLREKVNFDTCVSGNAIQNRSPL